VLQGVYPAIAVSHAATIQATKCTFRENYGYPLQYANKAEQDGTVDQDLLDQDPEEYARNLVEIRTEWASKYEDNLLCVHLFTEEGKESMFRQELAKCQERIDQVAIKCIKGSAEISDCVFENNALSPHLPEMLDVFAHDVSVQPWFAIDSRVMELVDEDVDSRPCYYMHNEARNDRATWEAAREPYYERETKAFSPAATLFQSLHGNESLINNVTKYFAEILSAADHFSFFLEQRRSEPNGSDPGLGTMYGLLDEEEKTALRVATLSKIEGNRRGLCDAVNRLTNAPHVGELLRICWGRLTFQGGSNRSFTAAEAGIVALCDKTGCDISPYRAEALVERMQCDADVTYSIACLCYSTAPPAEAAAFLLGLSHDSVVDALENLLKDKSASDHGRSNAGRTLMRLALTKPDIRHRVVGALSTAVSADSDLSRVSMTLLVGYLGSLHATESKEAVRNACMRSKVDDDVCGYVHFLCRVGLPVDLTDVVVAKEVSDTRVPARTKKAIKKHNATLRGHPPCDCCGKNPPKGHAFLVCTRCNKVYYCDADCQRAAWMDHKKVCEQLKRSSKKTK
jgi:hypothetical protein